MQVDFYQLGNDPAEQVVALLARNTLAAGQRLLVVADDPALLARTSEALWSARPHKGQEQFLANGIAGTPNDARQPVLLSTRVEPDNGAKYLVLADGVWREGAGMDRTFLVFGEAAVDAARATWRMLGDRGDITRNYWKQEDGRWIKAA